MTNAAFAQVQLSFGSGLWTKVESCRQLIEGGRVVDLLISHYLLFCSPTWLSSLALLYEYIKFSWWVDLFFYFEKDLPFFDGIRFCDLEIDHSPKSIKTPWLILCEYTITVHNSRRKTASHYLTHLRPYSNSSSQITHTRRISQSLNGCIFRLALSYQQNLHHSR